MPALSPTMETGTLAKWHIAIGDAVRAGDVIADIETDKATMELEATESGTVTGIMVAEGTADIAVGTVILQLGTFGANVAPPAAPPPPPMSPAAPAAQTDQAEATALGRKLGQLLGLSLSQLAARAPAQRIGMAAVMEAAGLGLPAAAAPAPAQVTLPAVVAPPVGNLATAPFETMALSGMRRTIARRLTESKQQVPHFYLTVDVVLDPLLALRARLNESLAARGIRISVNDMLLKAQACALLQVPEANVSFTDDGIRRFARADISVAVAIPGGLVTPVIRDASGKSVSAIATEMQALGAKARDGRLQPSEYSGGTASLTNLGMFGITQFDAVINPPEAMILAVGAAQPRAHVADGSLGIATMLTATGSFDHRAIDGAVAAGFMAAFRALVENPWQIVA
ncbi:MAG: 2-oxo acid dehydrogenase subunit E2 [Alphaproteobacteria bacterium]|nr:2-oxo acid dehydrogenase subunit E2 [Alphaproteobacteria bacterium]